MYALTLWQPWAWAIARAGKDVENRTWPPPKWLIGQRLAIHAGKGWDESWNFWADHDENDPLYECGAGIVAVVTVVGVITMGARPWFDGTGPYGWVLADVVPVDPPIPCRGRQGLWQLPPEVEAELEKRGAVGVHDA